MKVFTRIIPLIVLLTLIFNPTADAEIIDIGSLDTEGQAGEIAVANGMAYIAGGASGLQIIDISDPAEPRQVGALDTDGSTYGVAVAGDVAYLADGGGGLVVADVSDPTQPREITALTPAQSMFYNLQLVGDILYLTDLLNGLRIYDVSDPAQPEQIALFDTPDFPHGLEVVGDYAYIADRQTGLLIVDVSDVAHPTEAGRFDTASDARDVSILGDVALVADYSDGLRLIDVRDPENCRELGFWDSPGLAYNVEIAGHYAYLCDGASGLQILNVSNPAEPDFIGNFDTEGTCNAAVFAANLLYIADGESGLQVLELTPEIVLSDEELDFGEVMVGESAELTLTISNTGHADLVVEDITIDGRYFSCDFDGEWVLEGGKEWELTILFAPRTIGLWEGSLAIFSDNQGGGEVAAHLSGTGMGQISEVGSYNTPGYAYKVAVSDGFAYVTDDTAGLRIVDVSNPAQPRSVGNIDTPSHAFGVTVSDGFAYVCDHTSGLRIVDVSNPAQPDEVGYFDTPGYARCAVVFDGFAYVADAETGLRIIDVSNPSQPDEVGYLDTPGHALGVSVSDGFAFVADEGGGLRIIDVSDPFQPRESGYFAPPRSAWGVAISGEFAYVADLATGLRILEISEFVPGIISVEQSDIDYGWIDIGEQANAQLHFSNIGGDLLTVADIQIEGEYFSTDFDGEFILDPDESREITVTFAPEEVGVFEETLTIFSDDYDHPELTITLTGTGIPLQRVNIIEGWSMISLNVSPAQEFYREGEDRGPDVVLLLEQLRIDEDNHHVILAKDERGNFYSPDFGFTNIPYWNLSEGYQIDVDSDLEASWAGEAIPADADITIDRGWNMIAYFPDYELSASAPDFYALSPIIDHVTIAKDDFGNFLSPEYRFSNMPPWRPGKGYQICVDADVTLNYPPEQEQVAALGNDQSREAVFTVNSPVNMSLLVQLPSASEGKIQAVDAAGKIIGEGVIGDDGRCGLAVWGDDILTSEREGLTNGEAFSLKLADTNGDVLPLDVVNILAGDGLVYETDGFVAIDAAVGDVIPQDYMLSAAYPNPFNAITRLSYGLPDAGRVSLSVYDVAGRQVATLFDGERNAGMHSVSWNAEGMPSGLYIVRMTSAGANLEAKVLLMK